MKPIWIGASAAVVVLVLGYGVWLSWFEVAGSASAGALMVRSAIWPALLSCVILGVVLGMGIWKRYKARSRNFYNWLGVAIGVPGIAMTVVFWAEPVMSGMLVGHLGDEAMVVCADRGGPSFVDKMVWHYRVYGGDENTCQFLRAAAPFPSDVEKMRFAVQDVVRIRGQ